MFFDVVVSLQISFDVLACGDNAKLQFRCYFGETGEYSLASYIPKIPPIFSLNETGSFLECWKPVLLNQNATIQLRIAFDFWNSSNRKVFFDLLRKLANRGN